jgi:predicted branched-subunit amino acid permease
MDENRIGPTGRDDAQAARPVAFTRGGLLHGMKRGIPLWPSVIFGLVFGVLSRQAGLTVAQACLMSGVVNAGSSQLVALSMWATPVPILPIVATTLLINMRLVVLAITLRPWYARLPAPAAYGTYFFLTDGAWALAFVELQKGSPDGAFMLGVGIVHVHLLDRRHSHRQDHGSRNP